MPRPFRGLATALQIGCETPQPTPGSDSWPMPESELPPRRRGVLPCRIASIPHPAHSPAPISSRPPCHPVMSPCQGRAPARRLALDLPCHHLPPQLPPQQLRRQPHPHPVGLAQPYPVAGRPCFASSTPPPHHVDSSSVPTTHAPANLLAAARTLLGPLKTRRRARSKNLTPSPHPAPLDHVSLPNAFETIDFDRSARSPPQVNPHGADDTGPPVRGKSCSGKLYS
eukprot:3360879-Prymnesium_polylepis.1